MAISTDTAKDWVRTVTHMKLTKAERRQLRQALSSAIQWEDSLADAYHVAYNKRCQGPKIVPPEFRHIVARCKRRIAAYRKLYEKLGRTTDIRSPAK